jgi:hypothetical protein
MAAPHQGELQEPSQIVVVVDEKDPGHLSTPARSEIRSAKWDQFSSFCC